jgi:hypothetical protein
MQGTSFFRPHWAAFARSAAAASLCGAVLAGCGGSAPLFTSDGRPTTAVQCSAAGPWGNCMDNARGLCGGEIDVIAQSEANGAHKLLFACKAK